MVVKHVSTKKNTFKKSNRFGRTKFCPFYPYYIYVLQSSCYLKSFHRSLKYLIFVKICCPCQLRYRVFVQKFLKVIIVYYANIVENTSSNNCLYDARHFILIDMLQPSKASFQATKSPFNSAAYTAVCIIVMQLHICKTTNVSEGS